MPYGTTEVAAEKVEKQIPRGLKPARDDRKEMTCTAQLKLRPFERPAKWSFSAACEVVP
jgi:hypothetical protein